MEISRWISSLSCVWPEGGADNTKAAEIYELPVGYILFNGVSYSKIILINYLTKTVKKDTGIMAKRNAKTVVMAKNNANCMLHNFDINHGTCVRVRICKIIFIFVYSAKSWKRMINR